MTERERSTAAGAGHGPAVGEAGRLYVCGTPIGNLEDATFRLLRTLREVSLIAAEDTRHTRKLLSHFHIRTPLVSLHEHNEAARIDELLRRLARGEAVALVSDAGMPTISDPGARLVRAVADAGFDIVVVPGPTALTTALAGSGLPADRFVFEGFLPRQGRARRERLAELAGDPRTMVFYEAPHRLRRTLRDMLDAWGDRPACIARELTKAFEQWLRGPLSELVPYWDERDPRGEFVIVVAGADATGDVPPAAGEAARAMMEDTRSHQRLALLVRRKMSMGMDKKTAVQTVARELGVPRRMVYRAATIIDAAPGEQGSDD